MSTKERHITVYEHEHCRHDQGERRVPLLVYEALKRFHGDGTPFFRLIHNGIQFNAHVGVLQVGNFTIEVLPKADRAGHTATEEKRWRDILIDMMRAVADFPIEASEASHLKIKPNSILDLYFELFISEVEYLLHTGLVKQYRQKEQNTTALKGSLRFAQQIRYNLVHQERVYVRHTIYDANHRLNAILYKTVRLIKQINTHPALQSRIGALLLNFPEMPDLSATDATFEQIVFSRKTQRYQKAIEIARLLLLRYHPDVRRGQQHVLALMFDMNGLWEQFLYITLRRLKTESATISTQTPKRFWKPNQGKPTNLKPDIWIQHKNGNIILDTKWKNLNGKNPSPEDLRQMYAYYDYFDAKKVALEYPSESTSETAGTFLPNKKDGATSKTCSVVLMAIPKKTQGNKTLVRQWQDQIIDKFKPWLQPRPDFIT